MDTVPIVPAIMTIWQQSGQSGQGDRLWCFHRTESCCCPSGPVDLDSGLEPTGNSGTVQFLGLWLFYGLGLYFLMFGVALEEGNRFAIAQSAKV